MVPAENSTALLGSTHPWKVPESERICTFAFSLFRSCILRTSVYFSLHLRNDSIALRVVPPSLGPCLTPATGLLSGPGRASDANGAHEGGRYRWGGDAAPVWWGRVGQVPTRQACGLHEGSSSASDMCQCLSRTGLCGCLRPRTVKSQGAATPEGMCSSVHCVPACDTVLQPWRSELHVAGAWRVALVPALMLVPVRPLEPLSPLFLCGRRVARQC